MKCQVDAIQWVVAEFFCGHRKPTRFRVGGGGGGGSSRIFLFRGLQKPARFSGGGVVP